MPTQPKTGLKGAGQATALPKTAQATFEPFHWTQPGTCNPLPADRVLETVGRIRDLTSGATLVLQMLEQSGLDAESGDTPMFDTVDAGRLLRLAIAASETAAHEAEELDSWAFRHHSKGGEQ